MVLSFICNPNLPGLTYTWNQTRLTLSMSTLISVTWLHLLIAVPCKVWPNYLGESPVITPKCFYQVVSSSQSYVAAYAPASSFVTTTCNLQRALSDAAPLAVFAMRTRMSLSRGTSPELPNLQAASDVLCPWGSGKILFSPTPCCPSAPMY